MGAKKPTKKDVKQVIRLTLDVDEVQTLVDIIESHDKGNPISVKMQIALLRLKL